MKIVIIEAGDVCQYENCEVSILSRSPDRLQRYNVTERRGI